MIYCNHCILPDTRPNILILPDGKCTACHNHQNKKKINWKNKKRILRKLLKILKIKIICMTVLYRLVEERIVLGKF